MQLKKSSLENPPYRDPGFLLGSADLDILLLEPHQEAAIKDATSDAVGLLLAVLGEKMGTFDPVQHTLSRQRELRNKLYSRWSAWVNIYSSLGLTKPSDKLIAMQGIVKDIARCIDDEFVAGFWKRQLPLALCWQVACKDDPDCNERRHAHRTGEWRAPTWSWASCDGEVYLDTHWYSSPVVDGICVEVRDLDIGTRPSGALTHATLRLYCKPILATFHRRGRKGKWDPSQVEFKQSRHILDMYSIWDVCWKIPEDDEFEVSSDPLWIVFILLKDENGPGARAEGILLRPKEEGGEVFERIGHCFTVTREDVQGVQAELESIKARLIELV